MSQSPSDNNPPSDHVPQLPPTLGTSDLPSWMLSFHNESSHLSDLAGILGESRSQPRSTTSRFPTGTAPEMDTNTCTSTTFTSSAPGKGVSWGVDGAPSAFASALHDDEHNMDDLDPELRFDFRSGATTGLDPDFSVLRPPWAPPRPDQAYQAYQDQDQDQQERVLRRDQERPFPGAYPHGDRGEGEETISSLSGFSFFLP